MDRRNHNLRTIQQFSACLIRYLCVTINFFKINLLLKKSNKAKHRNFVTFQIFNF